MAILNVSQSGGILAFVFWFPFLSAHATGCLSVGRRVFRSADKNILLDLRDFLSFFVSGS